MSTPQSPNNLSGKSSKQRIRAAIDLHLRDRIRIEDATTSGMGFDVEQKIDAWERIGFLDDEIFVRNFLDRMNRIQVFGDTKKQDLEHPDCVAVGRTKRGVCCSGTLVAPRVVITAAHCNSPSQCEAKFVFFGKSVEDPEGFCEEVTKVVPSPDCDLAVLILKEPVTRVRPRLIATKVETDRIKQQAYIAGFGATDKNGRTGAGTRLIAGPANFADGNISKYGANPKTELVVGIDSKGGADSCNKDSGGPLYIKGSDGEDVVCGATSRPVAGSKVNCGDGGIYVRLDRVATWIARVAQENKVEGPVVR